MAGRRKKVAVTEPIVTEEVAEPERSEATFTDAISALVRSDPDGAIWRVNFAEENIREAALAMYLMHGDGLVELLKATLGGAVTYAHVAAWRQKLGE